ncbi:hypothetical protein TNCV_3479981 [Trichonephila clavipes]|nr:hypothetical protein TNCV_3479981 [Trichonephila clavipes]
MALLAQTVRECICVSLKNRTREAEGDFCGLPMRRDEGRVMDFKRSFFRRRRRALDGENLTRALKKGRPRLEWKERRDDERQWR